MKFLTRRPGKGGQLNIRIDKHLLDEVRLIAALNKTTVTDVITKALHEYIEKDPAKLDSRLKPRIQD